MFAASSYRSWGFFAFLLCFAGCAEKPVNPDRPGTSGLNPADALCPGNQTRVYPKNFKPVGGELKGHFYKFPEDCYTTCKDNPTACASPTRCVPAFSDSCQPFPENAPSGTHDDACWVVRHVCMPISKGEACAQLVGSYKSAELKDCGNNTTCNWTLEFLQDGSFRWNHDGVIDSGQYYCHEGTVYVDRDTFPIDKSHYPENRTSTFNAVTKTILWGEDHYHRNPSTY